jgi:hypothetical protein
MSADQHDNDEIHVTYAGAKRRIAALEQQLKDLQTAGTKQKLYGYSFCWVVGCDSESNFFIGMLPLM